jgi:hypothetical protein
MAVFDASPERAAESVHCGTTLANVLKSAAVRDDATGTRRATGDGPKKQPLHAGPRNRAAAAREQDRDDERREVV